MSEHAHRSMWHLAVIVALALAGSMAREGQAATDFTLHDSQELTILGKSWDYGYQYDHGWLYDQSRVIIEIGAVGYIDSYNSSTVGMSGGGVLRNIWTHDFSTANISGGDILGSIYTSDSSTVNMSGGQVSSIYTYDSSILTFNVQSWNLGDGLSLINGDQVLGSGVLSGIWNDGTTFSTSITDYRVGGGGGGVVPEPLTILSAFLAVGGLGGYIRRQVRKASAGPGLMV